MRIIARHAKPSTLPPDESAERRAEGALHLDGCLLGVINDEHRLLEPSVPLDENILDALRDYLQDNHCQRGEIRLGPDEDGNYYYREGLLPYRGNVHIYPTDEPNGFILKVEEYVWTYEIILSPEEKQEILSFTQTTETG